MKDRTNSPKGEVDVSCLNALDEVSAAAAIVFASFTENGVSTLGETIEVKVPEFVLIEINLE